MDAACWTPARLVAALASRGPRPAIVTMEDGRPRAWPGDALARDIERLATGLVAAGIGQGEPVAIHAPNSPDWIVVRLALGAAGALPIAIDDLSGAEEAAAIVADAGCRWLFASAAHAAAFPPRDGLRIVLVDRPDAPEGWHALRAEAAAPLPDLPPEAEAMVVYTSGTTGAPKSFALTHANLTANLRGVIATGHESLDTDTSEEMLSETWLLKHGHYQIEAMSNLDKVPPTGALLVVSWPKVKNGLGFPARAFAILP